MNNEWLTSVEKRHKHDQGDHNVHSKAEGHFNVDPMKLLLVLRNGFDILIPVLIWGGHTQILDNMDKFPKQVALCPELPRGGNLDNEHGQSVDTHDDQEHLE